MAVGKLMREQLGVEDLEVVRRCHDLTGGHPVLLGHVVETLAPETPSAMAAALARLEVEPPAPIVDAVAEQLEALSSGGRGVAEAAAVAGRHATVGRLRALTDLPAAELARRIGELADAGLVRGADAPALWSPIEAAAVLHRTAAGRRLDLHARMARLLHAQGGADDDIAHHLCSAAPVIAPWVGPTLLRAGRRAVRSGDLEGGTRLLRMALESQLAEDERCQVLEALARAELALGDPAVLGRLRTLAERSGRPEHRLRLAKALITHGSPRDAVNELEALLASTDDDGVGRKARVQLLTALRQDLGLRRRSRSLVEELTEVLRADAGADPGTLAELAYEQVLAGVPRDVVLELAHRALDGAQRGDVGANQSHILFLTLLWAGDHGMARRLVQILERTGDLSGVQLHRRAALAFAVGCIEEAVVDATAALDVLDVPVLRPSTAALLARCHVRLGQPDRAAAILTPIVAERRVHTWVTYHPVLLACAEVNRASGDWDGALRAAEDCADFSARMGTDNPVVVPWHPVAAEALEALGRGHEAVQLADEALGRLDRFGRRPAEVCSPLVGVQERLRPPAARPAAVTSIRVIGESQVRTAGSVTPLRDDLVDRALRYLAVHDRPILREELAEVLWPDLDPATGRQRLRKVLSRLRARHGELIVSRGTHLVVAPGVEVDLRAFQRLARDARCASAPADVRRAGRAALAFGDGDVCPLERYQDWAIDATEEYRRERDRIASLLDG